MEHRINFLKRENRKKKGESMLVDFWAILIFAIIALAIFIIIIISRSDNTQRINEEFSGKDVNLMLNSFLRAPYGGLEGKTMAQIISEDKTMGDYTRTIAAFDRYFGGVDIYRDNPVGGYTIGIEGNLIYFYNLNNQKFFKQAGESLMKNNLWSGGFVPMPVGAISKTIEGQNIDSLKYALAETTIPSIGGSDIKVSIVIIYDEKNVNKFS